MSLEQQAMKSAEQTLRMIEEHAIARALCGAHSAASTFCTLFDVMGTLYEEEQEHTDEQDNSVIQGGNYSAENYVYGSTYFPSWLKVFSRPAVLAAVKAAKRAHTPQPVVILGVPS